MARVAALDGIAVVCATPHIRSDHHVRIGELPSRVQALQRELDDRGVAVRIARGAEVAQASAAALGAEALRELSFEGRGWILLEPDPGPLADELDVLVARLADQGVRSLIAHPERHAGADFARRLRSLTERGCLIQWTADFLLRSDLSDSQAPLGRLARDGLVHLLASDAHSSHGGRQLRLSGAFARLGVLCPPEWVQWISREAPAAILRGEDLTPPF